MSTMLRTLVASSGRRTALGSLSAATNSRSASNVSVIPDGQLSAVPLINEPILGYAAQSRERRDLTDALAALRDHCEDIPIVIGGEEIRTNQQRRQVRPHEHGTAVATYYYADRPLLERAIRTATEAQRRWDRVSLEERLRIWQRAADLMAGPYRQQLNAATMLGQAKTVIQAEIDAAAELIDFVRMNAHYLSENARYRPISEDARVTKNSMRYRGIDGFVAAVSPFNFTAIGGNLAYTPALMGNAVLWKPSDTAMLSNWVIFKIMREAGVPDGVVNFVPADGPVFGDTVTASPDLAGINFTGSVPTFQRLWKQVGQNIGIYRNFPRLIGECGGKNFHFVHPTADVQSVATATIRAAFEFSGQKCSACSRAYVPASLWPQLRDQLVQLHAGLKVGDVQEFDTFTSAVIDERAWERITGYIAHAKATKGTEIVAGGQSDNRTGYFVQPTIVKVNDPLDKMMTEEIFGPVVAIYVYPDAEVEKTLQMVGDSTAFALTGSVFAQDQKFLEHAFEELRQAAGNFYINDKSTGSVVGQQPFGGGRHSGTNDKAGGPHYCLRWASPQSVKETFVPLRDVGYPYMKE